MQQWPPNGIETIGDDFEKKLTPTKTTIAVLVGQRQPSWVNAIVTSICPIAPITKTAREACRNDIDANAHE